MFVCVALGWWRAHAAVEGKQRSRPPQGLEKEGGHNASVMSICVCT